MSAIDFTNASGTASNVNADGTVKTGSTTVSKDDFLNLLVTQLKNQDPLNPTDQTQMLAQLAQFSSLEQLQNLNQTLTTGANLNQLAQTAGLIGKTVTTSGTDSTAGVTGVVSAVTVQNGQPFLHIGDQDVDAATVVSIQ